MSDHSIKIIPLLSLSENGAVSNLICVDNLNVLFDCGCDEKMSKEIFEVYQARLTGINIKYIFISNNTVNHFGALPFLLKQPNFVDAEVYTTTPISKLGFYAVIDLLISKIENEDFTFYNERDSAESFQRLRELKFDEKKKITENDIELIIYPVSSGYSLGGSAWIICFNGKKIIYAPQISIDNKNICDPFKYELFKHPYLLFTESKISNQHQITRYAVEKKFKTVLLNTIKTGKNIMIPSDSANFSLEIVNVIEKILSDYETKAKEENLPVITYKILFCNSCSTSIIEDVKTQTEWMCSKISKQFCNYSENPFCFQYLRSVNFVRELNELKNQNHIIISSMDSLDRGFSHKILHEILVNHNYEIFFFSKSYPGSTQHRLINSLRSNHSYFQYVETKRSISQNHFHQPTTFNIPEQKIQNDVIMNEVPIAEEPISIEPAHTIQKQFFANDKMPMFTFEDKRTFKIYGEVIKPKEMKLMEKNNDERNENIKAKLINNITITHLPESRIDLLSKINYLDFRKSEYENKQVKILNFNSNISFFDFFQDIDYLSLEILLKEISPENVIFTGSQKDNELLSTLMEKFAKKESNSTSITFAANKNEKEFHIKREKLNIKYDSNVLKTLDRIEIINYGLIYKLNENLLKIKRPREENEAMEITILDKAESDAIRSRCPQQIVKYPYLSSGKLDNKIITTSKLMITDLKTELAKILKDDLFIVDNAITNKKQDFRIQTSNNEVVIQSTLTPEYFRIRESLYSIYNDQMNFNKD